MGVPSVEEKKSYEMKEEFLNPFSDCDGMVKIVKVTMQSKKKLML